MNSTANDVCSATPLMSSSIIDRPATEPIMALRYCRADPFLIPETTIGDHHVLLSLDEQPHHVRLVRDGRSRDVCFKRGDVVMTPAGTRAGLRLYDESEVIAITIDPGRVQRFAETELGVILTDRQLQDMPFVSDPEISAAAVMVRDSLFAGGAASAVMYDALARVFLVKLIEKYGETMQDAVHASSRFTTAQYRRVMDHIEGNLRRTLSLDELAEVAGMSSASFSRHFKEMLGKTPMQHVMSYRVERAADLMRDPSLALSEVALQTGFADQAHLSRSFKQVHGRSPRSYRTALMAA